MAHLHIPRDFFKTEDREGFRVGEMMKRNWAAQLQVLEDVREMCERHNIRYFAYAGTLLGAVRHKGFIPWDDDIDICCIGEDFIKFLYYAKDELDDRYLHLSPYDRAMWDLRSISRIANGDKLNFSDDHLDEWHDCPLAIGTDIFPFYYVARDKEKEDYVFDLLEKVESLYGINEYYVKLLKEDRTEEAKELEDLISASIIGLQEDTGFEFTAERTLANQLCMLYDQVCRFTTEDEADYVTRYNAYLGNRNYKIRKDIFYESTTLPFEMLDVPAPTDYDEFLKWQYGPDYMKPSRSGGGHDYPYFGQQIRVFQNKIELFDWMLKRGGDGTLKYENPEKQLLSDSKNEKCVVLYYTGVREMMIYGEYVIGKIRDLLSYFEAHRDTMQLWWCPGDFLDPADDVPPFERLVPELVEQYNALVEEYKTSGLGICDRSGNLNAAVDACDLYYGDDSFLSELFAKSGKPAYIQDYHTRWMAAEPTGNVFGEDSEAKRRDNYLFGGTPAPKFDDGVYLENGKGFACATNMNGLFRVDTEAGTCEYIHYFEKEKANAEFLYTRIVPFDGRLVLIPGSADHLVIYDPDQGTSREYYVHSDFLNEWHDARKYADCIINEGILYLFGERYTHVLRVDPESGEMTTIPTNHEMTVWMRHAAFREGGLIRLVSANSAEMLTFNLRTERLFVQKSYSEKKVMPRLLEQADKVQRLRDVDLRFQGGVGLYRDGVFHSYETEKGQVIRESENWISFEDMIRYVEWEKAK